MAALVDPALGRLSSCVDRKDQDGFQLDELIKLHHQGLHGTGSGDLTGLGLF